MNIYFEVIRKYAVFKGTASRKEYWLFILINIGIGFLLGTIEGMMNLFPEVEESVLSAIYTLFIMLPSIALLVRRLHDTNRSGWWALIITIPFVNLILLVFLLQGSKVEGNKYLLENSQYFNDKLE